MENKIVSEEINFDAIGDVRLPFFSMGQINTTHLLGIDESHFLRFKPCMVDNITIDYGASGEIIIAEGGVPQGIKVGMTFKELEIQTAHDYEGDDV